MIVPPHVQKLATTAIHATTKARYQWQSQAGHVRRGALRNLTGTVPDQTPPTSSWTMSCRPTTAGTPWLGTGMSQGRGATLQVREHNLFLSLFVYVYFTNFMSLQDTFWPQLGVIVWFFFQMLRNSSCLSGLSRSKPPIWKTTLTCPDFHSFLRPTHLNIRLGEKSISQVAKQLHYVR